MAAFLFHGPRAREQAVLKAESYGRMVVPPVGDEGLKVDTSRKVSELLRMIPVGDERGSIVIGPFDDASPEATDAMLKSIEDYDDRYIIPVLWAEDLGSVIGTIRSRCHAVWCPGDPKVTTESAYLKVAENICQAALQRKVLVVVENLKEAAGQEEAVMRASVEVLSKKDNWPIKARLLLWESLRDALLLHKNMNSLAALSAYLV